MGNQQSIEAIATRFVNLNSRTEKNFLADYEADIRPSCRNRLLWIAGELGQAWPSGDHERAEMILHELLFSTRIVNFGGQLMQAYGGSGKPFDYPAFRLKLDKERPTFQRRDILDGIAEAVFRASGRGLLRICRGRKRGWDCPTRLLVADERRRVYCYMRCGDEAKSRAKLKWWRENESKAARKARGQARKGRRPRAKQSGNERRSALATFKE
jgi:hypothetical protein